jgi:hypothetical protein
VSCLPRPCALAATLRHARTHPCSQTRAARHRRPSLPQLGCRSSTSLARLGDPSGGPSGGPRCRRPVLIFHPVSASFSPPSIPPPGFILLETSHLRSLDRWALSCYVSANPSLLLSTDSLLHASLSEPWRAARGTLSPRHPAQPHWRRPQGTTQATIERVRLELGRGGNLPRARLTCWPQ